MGITRRIRFADSLIHVSPTYYSVTLIYDLFKNVTSGFILRDVSNGKADNELVKNMEKRQPWPDIRYLGICLERDEPSGRADLDVGLRLLACWDCGFESCRGHGCLL
jgi:hypothetical protein